MDLSGVQISDTVVEIGCGAGTLTRALAEKAKRVIGFEVDRTLQPVLARTLAGLDNVEVIFKDFLKVDLNKFEEETGGYKVVANLPYYITTPLIMKIVEESKRCKTLSVMVQEEVALRLCAVAGTADYGAITAMIAPRADCKIIKKVPRTMFFPRPNVDSAVVKLDFAEKIAIDSSYKAVVQAAFSSRRKTLENNLINSFKLTRSEAQKVLSDCGIDMKARGETLDYLQFARLAKALKDNHYM